MEVMGDSTDWSAFAWAAAAEAAVPPVAPLLLELYLYLDFTGVWVCCSGCLGCRGLRGGDPWQGGLSAMPEPARATGQCAMGLSSKLALQDVTAN